ncbi:unnamed protein product [Caenorhabditis auriculariae]|uniref:Uncharacterized protein n=1 Tax=Caenorhabditis auriculariae TaxID=2777116 RepID=A0A8S1GVY3_9PELO|nr:unnamed protein product [Caenorhabditis auriculariae]
MSLRSLRSAESPGHLAGTPVMMVDYETPKKFHIHCRGIVYMISSVVGTLMALNLFMLTSDYPYFEGETNTAISKGPILNVFFVVLTLSMCSFVSLFAHDSPDFLLGTLILTIFEELRIICVSVFRAIFLAPYMAKVLVSPVTRESYSKNFQETIVSTNITETILVLIMALLSVCLFRMYLQASRGSPGSSTFSNFLN